MALEWATTIRVGHGARAELTEYIFPRTYARPHYAHIPRALHLSQLCPAAAANCAVCCFMPIALLTPRPHELADAALSKSDVEATGTSQFIIIAACGWEVSGVVEGRLRALSVSR